MGWGFKYILVRLVVSLSSRNSSTYLRFVSYRAFCFLVDATDAGVEAGKRRLPMQGLKRHGTQLFLLRRAHTLRASQQRQCTPGVKGGRGKRKKVHQGEGEKKTKKSSMAATLCLASAVSLLPVYWYDTAPSKGTFSFRRQKPVYSARAINESHSVYHFGQRSNSFGFTHSLSTDLALAGWLCGRCMYN